MEKMRLLNTYVNNVTLDEAVEFLLQKIRDHFGDQVIINSGYRTVSYNAEVNGAAKSQHCKGTAADIVVKGQRRWR